MYKLMEYFLIDQTGETSLEVGVIFGLLCVVSLGWLPRLLLK